MDTLRDVFKAFPLACRKDIGGFVCVAWQGSDGVWRGRAWRLSDWKPFIPCEFAISQEEVWGFYRERVQTLKAISAG